MINDFENFSGDGIFKWVMIGVVLSVGAVALFLL
jgi:hypothetical protein